MADNIEVGELVARISFDDTGLNKSLAEINRQMKLVESEFGKASAGVKDFGSTSEQLQTKATSLTRQMQLQQQRINQLNDAFQKSVQEKGEDAAATQRLAAQLNDAQARYNRLNGQLDETNRNLAEQERNARIASSEWTKLGKALSDAGDKMKKVGDSMKDVGKNMSTYVSAPLAAMGGLAAKAAIDFESAFAGVEKTVDATTEELAAMRQGLRDMAKLGPSTANELAAIAEAAGQLGIQNESILTFTSTMSDLGTATNMTSEEAATALARLANITKMSQKDFDKLGASIVALGNNYATTESEITEMALRLAGAGAQVGMSEADILGLSAALSSVGIEAEMGGSAISRVMVRMQVATSSGFTKVQEILDATGMSIRDLQMMASHSGKAFGFLAEDMGMTKKELSALLTAGVDLENFAKIAGMTGEQFKDAFEVNAVGALGAFINGLGGAEAAGDSAINMLQEMGISEIRLRDSLLRAGNASELFAGAVELSNQAWVENTALIDEATKRYATTESQLLMLKNNLIDVGITIGEILLPIIRDMVAAVIPWIERFGDLGESTQKIILVIAGIAAAIGPVLVVVGALVSSIGTIVSAFGAASAAIGAAGGASAVFGAAIAAITGPVGIAIASIVAIVAAITVLYKKNEDFRAFVDKTWASIKKSIQQAWQAIVDFVMPIVDDMVAFFKEQFAELQLFWEEHGDTIMAVVEPIFKWIVGFVKLQMTAMTTAIGLAWTLIKANITITWEAIKLIISTAIDWITGLIKIGMKILNGDWKGAWEELEKMVVKIWGNIEKFFKNINLGQIGKDIMMGLINGIKSMAGVVADTAKDVAESIGKGIKNVLGINSPSKVTTQLGEWTGEGLAIGMSKTTGAVAQQAAALSAAAIPSMGRVGSTGSNTQSEAASTGTSVNFEGMFSGAQFIVRKDADIKAIAQELFSMQRSAMRGAGMG